MKNIFILIVILIFANSSYSQQNKFKERKNIYLLDVTLSMWGEAKNSVDIFDNVRNELINSINSIQNPKTEIVVVTFQDKVLQTWSEKATKTGKEIIISKLKAINKNDLKATRTNIYCAWKKGRELVNPNKLNVIYLLTDGVQNTHSPSKDDLYNEVENWEDFSKGNDYYAFLVELVENAKDEKLRNTINSTLNAQVISGINFFVFSIKDNQPIVNLYEKLEFELDFVGDKIDEIPNDFEFSVKTKDENFKLEKETFKLNEKPITIRLIHPNISLNSLQAIQKTEWYSKLIISFNQDKYPNVKLLNNVITLKIKNKKEMVLDIKFIDN